MKWKDITGMFYDLVKFDGRDTERKSQTKATCFITVGKKINMRMVLDLLSTNKPPAQ